MDLVPLGLFVASFVVGFFALKWSPVEHKTVFVYPTVMNYKKLQYKDSAGTCFHLKKKEVACTADADDIPFQY